VTGGCRSLDRLTGMRGDEPIQDGMFSYVSLEQRVPYDLPLRGSQTAGRRIADVEPGALNADCVGHRSPVVYSARASVAAVLFGVHGAAACRADLPQPSFALVCWSRHGRRGVEPRGIFQEP
jgi:hypothetical protein